MQKELKDNCKTDLNSSNHLCKCQKPYKKNLDKQIN